jgi:hypothetical protein
MDVLAEHVENTKILKVFDTLVVTQLLKKFAALYRPHVLYRVHNSPSCDPAPSQLNPVSVQSDLSSQDFDKISVCFW